MVQSADTHPQASGLVPNPDGPGVILGGSHDEGGFAWIANSQEGTVSKLDVATGADLGRYKVGLTGTAVDSPSRTAVDDLQNAYVANLAFGAQRSVTKIAGFDRYCVDRNGNGTIDTSHGATPNGNNPYGITVDMVDRVWIGAWTGGACRYNPASGSWFFVDTGGRGRGIAVDEDNVMWVTNDATATLYKFNADDGSARESFAIPATTPIGVGADPLMRVWVINYESNDAARFDKATRTFELFPVGAGPYTYSDFVGYQRRLVMPTGTWIRMFERCDTHIDDMWKSRRPAAKRPWPR